MSSGYHAGRANSAIAQSDEYIRKINELRELRKRDKATIEKLNDRIETLEFSVDTRKAHQDASNAQVDFLVGLLDEAYGAENNPARKAAYEDPDALRVPSGSRQGEIVTLKDHAYLTGFIKSYKANYAKKWNRFIENWKDFLHERIDY